ncbi:hypothetical protein RQP46_007261 [Phenoliferia psychrophenolica]
MSSAYSAGGSRLSATHEVDSDSEMSMSDVAVDIDGEDEDGDDGALGPRYANTPGQAFLAPPSHSAQLPSIHGVTESTPLLAAGAAGAVASEPDGRTAARQELGILLGYMLPIVGTHFLEYSLLVVTVISVGHIGTVELAAASLASMTSNVVALSVIQGFCTALDTLCPQAYTSKPKDTSLYALRTFYLLMILIVPQIIIFWNSEYILLCLKQDPSVAYHAALYLKVLGFGLPGYAGFECVRRWLQAQGLMLAPVLTLIVAAPLNVILNYLLVWGPESIKIGFVGAPLATAISMNSMFVVSLVYAYFYAPREAWGGFSWAIMHDLGINIRLGLAVTSASLFYQIPYALSVAGAVRVGNLLGAQRPNRARVASRVTMYIAVIVAGANSSALVLARHSWGKLFSSEDEVIQVVAGVLPLVALFQLTDGLSGAAGGLLRGAGRATLGALINLTSYYVVGLPIGLTLAFVGPKLGLLGLWVGLTTALTFTAGLMTTFIWRMDWEAECELARKRMGLDKREGVEEA